MAFRGLRRGLLLLVGTMGSFCVVCLLVHSGAALWQPPAGETTPKILAFPMEIPGTTLVARHLILYEGGFLEDGSQEYEANVAAVLLENTGSVSIESARVILHWEDGAYVFDVDMLPPGLPVIVLERSRQPYEQKSWTACQGIQKIAYAPWESCLEVSASDITLQITNPTDQTVRDVCVYFKDYLKDQDILVGGIVHSCKIGDIPPHTTVTAEPYHFVEGYSKILCVDHQK